MKFSRHIELHEANGLTSLAVRDWELFDFLDDHFAQIGLETSPACVSDSPLPYQLHFVGGTTAAKVWAELEAIGSDEIDRIAALNSSAKDGRLGT